MACACGHTWHCMYVHAVYVCVMCTGTDVCHNVCTCRCVCTGESMHVSVHAGEQKQRRPQSITAFNPFPRGRRAAQGTQAEAPALTWGSCHSDPIAPAQAGLSLSPHPRGCKGLVTHRNLVSSDFRPKRNQVGRAKGLRKPLPQLEELPFPLPEPLSPLPSPLGFPHLRAPPSL